MNKVQLAAYDLIQSDAIFLCSIINIRQNAKNISSNYICMSSPYIGLFADGAEQWGKKVGLRTPQFTSLEKNYYQQLRQSHKLFELEYDQYAKLLLEKFKESDEYFYNIRSNLEKEIGYYNVGTDLCNGEFCGNTILCSMYFPNHSFGNKKFGPWIRDVSIVAGKLAASFGCTISSSYTYDDNLKVNAIDYHFYKKTPLKLNNDFGFLLFSILCSINFPIEFIENYFTEEIPQKFKFAYLQYYYLCNFIPQLNSQNNTCFSIDNRLYDRSLRNCLAHYGLGQYFKEYDIINSDTLKGLTNKALGMDYLTAKNELYQILKDLANQIKGYIFK